MRERRNVFALLVWTVLCASCGARTTVDGPDGGRVVEASDPGFDVDAPRADRSIDQGPIADGESDADNTEPPRDSQNMSDVACVVCDPF
jgi:hypothetical protein